MIEVCGWDCCAYPSKYQRQTFCPSHEHGVAPRVLPPSVLVKAPRWPGRPPRWHTSVMASLSYRVVLDCVLRRRSHMKQPRACKVRGWKFAPGRDELATSAAEWALS